MFDHLQIYDTRERWLVGCADALLDGCAACVPRRKSRQAASLPQRILLLRLERIGDLLMTLGAIAAVRARAPAAAIHLVVGSWNASLAQLIGGIDSCETLDAPWLARDGTGLSNQSLIQRALAWRKREFDLALNFEPDIRSNVLLRLGGASRRVGFSSSGGGALLTDALSYVASAHTAVNALAAVNVALPAAGVEGSEIRRPRLQVPADARLEARRLLDRQDDQSLLIGIHASGGRVVKQWRPERFAQVATQLARDHGAKIVLTGTAVDRPLVDRVRSLLPSDVSVLDVAGSMTLPVLAALLEQLGVFVSSDTGPMHLAAAVGTPVVALFGPSDPRRYGPLSDRARVMTAELWCRPCNRVRLPPSRCVGRVPDCLNGIDVAAVCAAASSLLSDAR